MNLRTTLASAAGAVTLLASGAAGAALYNGNDGSSNTSVFISVVERNATNNVVRNLVIDTGARALSVFAGTPWSTTTDQESAILAFLSSATGAVRFNIGGGLNDQSFSTDRYGFLTTGNAAGPASDGYSALGSAVTNIDTFIGNANGGVFSPAGVLTANSAIQPGWHNNAWGNTVGGAIEVSNEILFGQNSQLIGWKTDPGTFEIIRSALGPVTSNLGTGDISFGAVPVPAAVWLFGSALGLLGALRRRSQA
jgi:hypothetical protein